MSKYLPFQQARELVRNLGLKNERQWREYKKSDLWNSNLPATPNKAYENDGWVGWGDFLGNGNIASKNKAFLSFKDARSQVKKLKLKSIYEWYEYSKSDKRPANIPSNPQHTYADSGWAGMADWLGMGSVKEKNREMRFLPFEEARELARGLGLKSQAEWQRFSKEGKRPKNLPSHPNLHYAKDGWSGYGDWLGTKTEQKESKQKIAVPSTSPFSTLAKGLSNRQQHNA
jgi:hypothetical protein